MTTHKTIDRICAVVVAAALILTVLFINGKSLGITEAEAQVGYESRIFDTSKVHTIDIVMDDWDSFIENAASEEYAVCSLVIDNKAFKNVAIRAKGNTSLSTVSQLGSDRYSFKIEFDHYDSSKSYYGLDKLCLNNIIQDSTYMKDYLTYRMMALFGVDTPLCSFAYIRVNGEDWGLYLAVEAVEDSFLNRNYSGEGGDLYKPDSISMGGGRGNGRDFDADSVMKKIRGEDDEESSDAASAEAGGETSARDAAEAGAETDSAAGSEMKMPEGFEGGMPMNFSAEEQAGTASEAAAADAEAGTESAESFSGMPSMPSFSGDGSWPEPPDGAGGWPGAFDSSDSSAETTGEGDESSGSGRSRRGGPGGGFGGFGMGSDDVKLKYIDDDPDSYSAIFDDAKTVVTDADKARLIASLKSLGEGENIDEVVDVDEVLRYFVVHNYVVNSDSYTGSMIHNYYLYENDGQMSMIPWDYNLAYGTFMGSQDATASVNDPIDTPLSVSGNGDRPMAEWFLSDETYLEMYHSYFSEFLDTVDPVAIIEETAALIDSYVQSDPTQFYSYDEFLTGVETLKSFVTLRTESVRGQLDGTIPSTDEGQSEDSSALIDGSSINLSDMGSMGSGGGGGNMPGGGMPGGDMPGGSFSFTPGGDMPEGMPDFASGGNMPDFTADGNMPDFPGGDFAGGEMTQGGYTKDQYLMFGISLAVLAGGIIFALIFRRRKK